MLKRAIRGELTRERLERRFGTDNWAALTYLIKHGFVEEREDGSYAPTVDVAYSLGLIRSLPAPHHRRKRHDHEE